MGKFPTPTARRRKGKRRNKGKSNRDAATDTDGKTQAPLWTLPRENQDDETPREVEEEMRTPKNASMDFENTDYRRFGRKIKTAKPREEREHAFLETSLTQPPAI
ncbi:hypothetical protein M513_07820 [Trichuris suis]|uniref:Uncharacterized protein n=1 Tax=Trichuris suis TaxID=68888 RepID=A0A085M1X4_9BILA|nr:hypothetical protein M513_07820 [Trichuris suis]